MTDKALETFSLVGGPTAVSVAADYTGTGTIDTDKKLNYAAQGVADFLGSAGDVLVGPFALLGAGSSALGAVAYLAALGTNTAVLADDLNNPMTSGAAKTLSVLGDIIAELGDIVGHWACMASFVSKTVAIPYQTTADVLTIAGMTISGLTIENNVIPPFVTQYLGTAKSAATGAQGLVTQYGPQVNTYFGATGAAFVSDLTAVLASGSTALGDFGTQNFLSDASTFYSNVTQLETDAASLFTSSGPTNTTLTTTAGAGGVSFSDNTGVLTGTGLVGPVSPDGFGTPSLSGSFTLNDPTAGQYTSVSGTQLLATDGVATISMTASSLGSASQTTQFGLPGPLSQSTNLNGISILSPLSTPATISTGPSGNLSVNIPSATPANNVSIVQNPDGSVQILVGDPQEALDYAPGGLTGDTIDVSNLNGTLDITTDLGAGDTSVIASDDNISGVMQDFQFGTPDGVLDIDDPISFDGTIGNFLPGDAIVLVGISVESATIASGGILMATAVGGSTLSFQLDQSLDYSDYQLTADGDQITAEPLLSSSGEQNATVDAPVYDIQTKSTITYRASVGLAPSNLNFAAERTDDLWSQSVPVVATFDGGSLDPNAAPDSVYIYNSSSNASNFFITQGLTSGLGPDTSSGTIYVGSDYYSAGDYSAEVPPVSVSYDGSTTDVDLTANEKSFLAVSRGQKRRPLALSSHATHLIRFLCSAERGRFFVPA